MSDDIEFITSVILLIFCIFVMSILFIFSFTEFNSEAYVLLIDLDSSSISFCILCSVSVYLDTSSFGSESIYEFTVLNRMPVYFSNNFVSVSI